MRRLLHLGLFLSLCLPCATAPVQAQSCPSNYAQIVAAKLGAYTPLQTGSLTIIATDASHQPINYSVAGVGVVLTKPTHAIVVNGAITSPSPLCIPRSDQSSVPVGYHFILQDTSPQGGNAVVMDAQDVAVTTSVWSLDNYPFAPQVNPYTLTPFVPPAATVALGNVTVLPPGSTPSVSIGGTPTNALLNFSLAPGAVGPTGPPSTAMTISTVITSSTGVAQPYNQLIRCAGTLTYSLPSSPLAGEIFIFKNVGTGTCTLTSSALIDGQTTQAITPSGYQQSLSVAYDASTNTWNIF